MSVWPCKLTLCGTKYCPCSLQHDGSRWLITSLSCCLQTARLRLRSSCCTQRWTLIVINWPPTNVTSVHLRNFLSTEFGTKFQGEVPLFLGDIPITFQHSVVEGSLCAKTSSIRSAFLLRLVTDRRTDRYTATANTALAQRCAGKNWRWISLALWL